MQIYISNIIWLYSPQASDVIFLCCPPEFDLDIDSIIYEANDILALTCLSNDIVQYITSMSTYYIVRSAVCNALKLCLNFEFTELQNIYIFARS